MSEQTRFRCGIPAAGSSHSGRFYCIKHWPSTATDTLSVSVWLQRRRHLGRGHGGGEEALPWERGCRVKMTYLVWSPGFTARLHLI